MPEQNPPQPTVPQVEPIQTVQTPPMPIVETIQSSQPEVPQTPEPFYKNKIFIVVVIVLITLLVLIGGYYGYLVYKVKKSPIPNLYPNWTPYPMASFVPSTMAPVATPQEYRNPKGNVNDVNNLPDTAKNNLGVIKVPSTVNFIHTEVYKGVTIKWTAGQPIPSDRLQWLKNSLDTAPDFYTKNYPPQAILSMTTDELGMTPEQGNMATADYIAAASGTNIFLWPHFVKPNSGSSYYAPVDEKSVRETLMHEWMHVVQYYDAVETYTDDYIIHNIAGLYDLDYKDPLLKKFGDAAGWYYAHDYSATPTLKTDAESQKTTDYGKMLEYEDMADTASHVIICDTSMLSRARIDIMSQILGQSAQSFCK